jgi:transposase
MPKPCSLDLRLRLLEAVIAGASRREAAECMDVSASSAVKWLQRWQETGSVAAKPTGGGIFVGWRDTGLNHTCAKTAT